MPLRRLHHEAVLRWDPLEDRVSGRRRGGPGGRRITAIDRASGARPTTGTSASAATTAPRAPVPPFTPAHERLRAEMRAFVATRLAPHAEEWEAAEWFPNEAF